MHELNSPNCWGPHPLTAKLCMLFLPVFALALLVGCGGQGEDIALTRETRADVTRKPQTAGQASTEVDRLLLPVPAGAVRVAKFVQYYVNATDPRVTPQRAEDLIAILDQLQIPFNFVHCGSMPNGGFAPDVRFVLVIDVEKLHFRTVTQLDFVELTAVNTPQYDRPSSICTGVRQDFSAEQRIQGFARLVYPQFFASEPNGTYLYDRYEQFQYRYYPKTGNYLGLAGDDVYVHNGRNWNLQFVGKVKDFIPYIDGIPGSLPRN